MKKQIAIFFTAAITLLALFPLTSRAEYVNDFECKLNKGYTVPQLYAFQQEWMTAARKQGFTAATYNTRIWFPAYNNETSTDPLFFVWRGTFADGAVLGRMLDYFPPSEWAGKFAAVMNCGKASLWIAFQ
jgi:hypothetical protein